MNASVVVFIAFEATALLFVGLGVPLLRRKVRPNLLYGFRTPATLRDEQLWYEVNAHAGGDLIGIGVVLAVMTLVLQALHASPELIAIACTGWLGAGTLFMAVHGVLRIREQTRAR